MAKWRLRPLDLSPRLDGCRQRSIRWPGPTLDFSTTQDPNTMTKIAEDIDFGTPVTHDGHEVVLGATPSRGEHRDVPCISQGRTDWGNIEWRMYAQINGQSFRLQSRNTVTGVGGKKDQYTEEEMKTWLDYAVRLKTVYLAVYDTFVEEHDVPSGDPYEVGYGFQRNLRIGELHTYEGKAPLTDDQLNAVAQEHAKRGLEAEGKRRWEAERRRTWKVSHWTTSGKMTAEIKADSAEEALEEARDRGIEPKKVGNALYGKTRRVEDL